ncbi:flagella basal body P-ring formation protein FlgA [Pseudooceanicola sediminis]|uniref:Flagella basal body P-ring formation protein FlgA n=1 Tax=Pseudooceanicola sediminis TaxID=2211117 RepID=A0A399J4E1_9RHOB|nr:flagellar basal body P-ring formation chaperone FlgA [Pseudooceanicola sediminis]KAA2315574.1 flagellar basal body P-ring formation protein FlgA [Puniceibacterium sp. HSS470]RII40225.1 flagella basal body P-ring formation protein FlgA [Pseudooceanicola sediminis]|tara:strand:- start:14044 stop:14463 length:420 start_codon:yes stop_codon:yes gene_type:complete
MRGLITCLLLGLPGAGVLADTVVAARTLPAQSLIGPGDLVLREGDMPGALTQIEGLIGQETRVAIYAGRPLRMGDVGPPALIERNAIVSLVYDRGGLVIVAEARSLARAGEGESIRVMNLSSRQTVNGVVQPDGTVKVQ